MATMLVLLRELAERRHRDAPFPVAGTATGGSTTTVVDDGQTTPPGLVYSSGDSAVINGWWVYQEGDGETSRVTRGGYAGGTGTVTFSPAITGFASTDKYIFSKLSFPILKRAINLVLLNTYLPTFFPLSMHLMGNDANDMEPSTIATDYSSTNATNALESTIVFNGAQSLKVSATATGGYANTGNIGVPESLPLYAAAMLYVTSGDSGTFRVIDVTNSSATIEDATTDEPSWMELVYQFNTPSGCEQIDFRFIADANTDVIYVEDFQVWSTGKRVYTLPSWITRPSQVLGVRGFPQGTGGPASDNDFRSNERRSVSLPWGFERVDKRATNELQLWVDADASRPFIYALRPLIELTSDTSSTVAEEEQVMDWASRLLEAENGKEEALILGLLRASRLVRPVTELPTRVGVRIA